MRVILFIVALLACQCVMAAPDQALVSGLQRSITVQAQGFVEAVPDTLLLRLSVKKTGASLQEARAMADVVVELVVKTALQNGVEKQDIDSSQLSSWPEYQWRQDKREYLGESVQRDITLKLMDLDSYSSLIGQLSKLSLHRIHRPQLSHGNIDELRLQALRAALARGRTKAQLIATQIEGQLGPVHSVEELADTAMPGPRMMMAEAASADGAEQPGFNLASQRIHARVKMVFAMGSP